MVYRHISTDLKERALWLLDQGWIDEDIALLLGVSTRSIARWVDNYEQHGTVNPLTTGIRGRPSLPSTEARNDEDLADLPLESPELYLAEIQEWQAVTRDTAITEQQLCRILKDVNTSYRAILHAVDERDEDERATWREDVMNQYLASQILFVGGTSKNDGTIYRHFGRTVSGRRVLMPANSDRGVRFNIVCALGVDGYAAVKVVEGSVDADEFFDFIVSDVIPAMKPFPRDRSILIMDNSAIHKSKALREIIQGMGCSIQFLPPYSPDLNPIEESFRAVKAWLRQHWRHMMESDMPECMLYEATATATPEKSQLWIAQSGYII